MCHVVGTKFVFENNFYLLQCERQIPNAFYIAHLHRTSIRRLALTCAVCTWNSTQINDLFSYSFRLNIQYININLQCIFHFFNLFASSSLRSAVPTLLRHQTCQMPPKPPTHNQTFRFEMTNYKLLVKLLRYNIIAYFNFFHF